MERNYIVPNEVKELADKLGVKISLGKYGPVFTGTEESIEKIKDFYLSATSISSLDSQTKKNNIFAYANQQSSASVHKVENDLMSQHADVDEFDDLERDARMREKEDQIKRKELEKKEHEKKIQAQKKIKEMREIKTAMYQGAALSARALELAKSAELEISKNKNAVMTIFGDERLISEVLNYDNKIKSADLFESMTADNDSELTKRITDVKNIINENNDIRNNTNHVKLDSNKSLDDKYEEYSESFQEELKKDRENTALDDIEETFGAMERVLPFLK